jgi:shikimate kinase
MSGARGERIILVGFMGTGKTAVGARLARRLGFAHADSDRAVVRAEGRPIREIFARRGERYFRSVESRVLARLLRRRRIVVSAGGGAVLAPRNRRLFKRGTVVWIRAGVGTIHRRVRGNGDRPLLLGAPGGLRATLARLLKRREPLYRRAADITVRNAGSPERAVADILRKLRGKRSVRT